MNVQKHVSRTIRIFVNNFDKSGNIFSLNVSLDGVIPSIKFEKTCVFFSFDTVLCAWREILLSHTLRNTRTNICDVLDRYANDVDKIEKFTDVSSVYVRTIKNVDTISRKLEPEIGFFYYNTSFGLELYFLGLHEKFFEANKRLVTKINENGIRRMIIYSPQEFLAMNILKEKYNLNVELIPFLRFVGKNIGKLKQLGKKIKVIAQESCIMTRWLGFEDYIEWIETNSIEIVRHPLKGKLTVCCGEHMWYIDPEIAIRNTTERIKSLIHIGGQNILITCPNALFLFRVAKEFNRGELEGVRLLEVSEVLIQML